MTPLCLSSGHGGYLRKLQGGEKDELRALLAIVSDDKSWEELNKLEQLDLQKRASVLVTQFTVSRLYNFRR